MIDTKILEGLEARANRLGMMLGLDATRRALAELGDPHRVVPCVHVAGSNGKGSTCAMVESIARAAGVRTGLFTSPHLCQLTELIRLDGDPIADDAFARSVALVRRRCQPDLTVFETLTVAAFHAFREARVDLAIVEVGLGGLRDATNVITDPMVTAVTSIALDHTAQLGASISLIAREKAGILKPGAPVVLGPLEGEASRVIEAVARETGAGPIWRVEDGSGRGPATVRVHPSGTAVELSPPSENEGAVTTATLGLRGPHQLDNAGVAAGVAWLLARRWPAIHDVIADGLFRVRWPGRLERIDRGAISVLLDCAHNAHGAAAVARALPGEGCTPERTTLVFGALRDKAFGDMLEILAPCAARRFYTSPRGRAAAPLDDLCRVAPGESVADPLDALRCAMAATDAGNTVLVTGSSYLVGEIRGALLGIPCDPTLSVDLSRTSRPP